MYHIDNFNFLHRSKKESRINVFQQKAKSDEIVLNGKKDYEIVSDDKAGQIYSEDNNIDIDEDVDKIIDEIMSSSSQQNDDWYMQKVLDVNLDAGYFSSASNTKIAEGKMCYYQS